MAAKMQKVSVSLDTKELRWAKTLSKQTRSSVSALVNEAIRRLREEREREQAQQEFLAQFARDERATPAEMAAIREQWLRG